MSLQRILLRAMLALVGLAALAGVATIFLPAKEFLGRIAATLITSAFAIALALPASKKLDREETRPMGLAMLTAIVPCFVLVLASIWIGLVFGWRVELEVFFTAMHYAACAVVFLVALGLTRGEATRVSGRLAVVAALACFVIGVPAIWADRLGFGTWDLQAKLWGTSWLIFWSMVLAGMSLYAVTTRTTPWRWFGVFAAAAALAMGLYGIWNELKDPPVWFAQALIVALAIGLANVLNTLKLEGLQRYVALGTIGTVLLTAALLSYLNFITEGFRGRVDENELLIRLIAAGSIVSACGLLAITIFLAANRRALVTTSAAVKEIRSVKVTCPRCATKIDAAVGVGGGRSRCGGCGLIFVLELAEPRCVKCEYNLLDLKGDRCPECGTPVAESLQVGA
jgi:hypothetical protein